MKYKFELTLKLGNSVVRRCNFSTYGEAEGYARHNGYHKPNKKKIEQDEYYPNYEIIEH